MKKILLALVALSLVGCASPEYGQYLEAQVTMAREARQAADAKAAALVKVCDSGKESACLVAAFALGQANGSSGQAAASFAPPESAFDKGLRIVGAVLPFATQIVIAKTNANAMNHQSDNSTLLGIKQAEFASNTAASTNSAFVGIAGKIQAPTVVVPQANVTTILGGSGVIGSGSFSTQANPVTTTNTTTTTTTDNHSNQNNPVTNPITGK